MGDRGSKKAREKIQTQQVKKQKDKQVEKDAKSSPKVALPTRVM